MKRLRIIWHLVLIAALLVSADQSFASPPTSCPGASCVYFPFVSVPPPVHVNESTAVGTFSGTYRVLGDVVNTATYPLYDVVLTVRLYNPSLIGTKTVTTVLTATLPGQLNPFDIDTGFDAGTSSYDVTPSSWSTSSPLDYRPATVVLTETALCCNGVVVTSTIRNDQAVPLLNVQGVTWSLLDRNQFFRQSITPNLAPGASISFTTFMYEPFIRDPSSVRVAAQGVISP